MDTKQGYVEIEVKGWNMSLDQLEDFIRRARNAGHNSFDCDIEMGYYGDVENVTLRSEYLERNDPAKATTPNT